MSSEGDPDHAAQPTHGRFRVSGGDNVLHFAGRLLSLCTAHREQKERQPTADRGFEGPPFGRIPHLGNEGNRGFQILFGLVIGLRGQRVILCGD